MVFDSLLDEVNTLEGHFSKFFSIEKLHGKPVKNWKIKGNIYRIIIFGKINLVFFYNSKG